MFHGALQEDLAGDDGKRCPTYSDHHEGLLQRVTDLESTYLVVGIFFTEFIVALALMQPWSNLATLVEIILNFHGTVGMEVSNLETLEI